MNPSLSDAKYSATAEESAASAEQLSGQSVILKDQIDAFKLKN